MRLTPRFCPNIPDAPVPVLAAAITRDVLLFDAGSAATAAVAAATDRVLPVLASSVSNEARPAIIMACLRGFGRLSVACDMKLLERWIPALRPPPWYRPPSPTFPLPPFRPRNAGSNHHNHVHSALDIDRRVHGLNDRRHHGYTGSMFDLQLVFPHEIGLILLS